MRCSRKQNPSLRTETKHIVDETRTTSRPLQPREAAPFLRRLPPRGCAPPPTWRAPPDASTSSCCSFSPRSSTRPASGPRSPASALGSALAGPGSGTKEPIHQVRVFLLHARCVGLCATGELGSAPAMHRASFSACGASPRHGDDSNQHLLPSLRCCRRTIHHDVAQDGRAQPRQGPRGHREPRAG